MQCKQCLTLGIVEPGKEVIQRCEVCQYVLFDPAIPWDEEDSKHDDRIIEKISESTIAMGQVRSIEQLQDRLNQEILAHRHTQAQLEASAAKRIEIYMSTT